MVKVLFVCHGNICRSPMAEYVMKHIVKARGLEDKFFIDSCATSTEEIGNDVHIGTKRKLKSIGISCLSRSARQIKLDDFLSFDYILTMEKYNNDNLMRFLKMRGNNEIYINAFNEKVNRLLDFCPNPKDIADPWYTGNFDITFDEIKYGIEQFIEYLTKNGRI